MRGERSVWARLTVAAMVWSLAGSATANDVAVVVGVSDYAAFKDVDSGDLRWADEDARLFADTAVKAMKVAQNDVILLTSRPREGERKASAENIGGAITELAGRQQDSSKSRFIFYFSGHGVARDKAFLLAACDYDPSKPLRAADEALSSQAIRTRLSDLNVGLSLAVFDMCRYKGYLRANQESNREFALFSVKGNVATFFASGDGPSYEDVGDGSIRHGFFTYYLCKGMSPESETNLKVPAMGLDGDVTVARLANYVTASVAPKSVSDDLTPSQTDHGKGPVSSQLGQTPLFYAPGLESEALARYSPSVYYPASSAEEQYRVFLSRGHDLYMEKKFVNAGKEFESASSVELDNPPRGKAWASYAAGVCFQAANDFKKAEAAYRKAVEDDPSSLHARDNLGVVLAKQGNAKGAEDEYKRALARFPQASTAHYNLAILLHEKKRLPEAKVHYQAAINADPTLEIAHYNYALLCEELGDVDGAVKLYERAIHLVPDDPDPHANLGLILNQRREFAKARPHLQIAYKLSPNNANVASLLGLNLLGTLDYKGAEAKFREARRLDAMNGEYSANLALALLGQLKTEEARKLVDEARK